MKWKDTTSYSQSNKVRRPTSWTLNFGTMSLTTIESRHEPGSWFWHVKIPGHFLVDGRSLGVFTGEDSATRAQVAALAAFRSWLKAYADDLVRIQIQAGEAQALRYGASTIAALSVLGRDPSWADSQGKLRREGGEIVFAIGAHKGKRLADIPGGYLRWAVGDDFPADTKAILRAEIERRVVMKAVAAAEAPAPEKLDFDTRPDLTPEARIESYDPQSGRGL